MHIPKSTVSSPVWGDWDRETVRLDFDETPLDEVKYWAFRAMHWFKLEGFIILRSSQKIKEIKRKRKAIHKWIKSSYLVIFNRPVKWEKNVQIMAWVAVNSGIQRLKDYVLMQCIKRSSTLRISLKDNKPYPRIIFCYGKQNKQIRKFLETRKFILESLRKINRSM